MKTWEYVLRAVFHRLQGRVTFNGATVVRSWEPRLQRQHLRLNPWCLVGDNELGVELASFPPESLPEPVREEDVPTFWMHLYRVPDGAQPSSLFLLLRYEWQQNEAPIVVADQRAVFWHRFRITRRFGDWCWLAARPYEAGDREALLDTVERLHGALAEGDAITVQALLSIRRAEIVEALRMSLDEVEQEEMRFLESFFQEPDWAMEPFDRDQMRIHSDAGGRLVRLTGPHGELPLIGRGGGRPFVFDVTLSRVEDSWVIVR